MVDGVDLSNDIFGVDIDIEATKDAVESGLQEDLKSGVGGNEKIEGGKPHVMQSRAGKFTTPFITSC